MSWSTDRERDWRTPDSVSVMRFLQSFHASGATVPKRHFDSLRWLEQNFGVLFGTDLSRVRRIADPPSSHAAVQATPYPPVVWMTIENGPKSKNEFLSALCTWAAIAIVSAQRPTHLQLSMVKIEDFIEAEVLKGKRVIKGRQPSFGGQRQRWVSRASI